MACLPPLMTSASHSTPRRAEDIDGAAKRTLTFATLRELYYFTFGDCRPTVDRVDACQIACILGGESWTGGRGGADLVQAGISRTFGISGKMNVFLPKLHDVAVFYKVCCVSDINK